LQTKLITKWPSEGEPGAYCEIHFNITNEEYYIEYYNSSNKLFMNEFFPGKSIHYVGSAAENWCSGIKKLK